jgi:hypothetical protein
MRHMLAFVVAGTVATALGAPGLRDARAGDSETIAITVGGRADEAWGWSLSGEAAPTALEDVIAANTHFLTRGPEPSLDFIGGWGDDRLRLKGSGNDSSLVAIRLRPPRSPSASRLGPRESDGLLPPTHGGAPSGGGRTLVPGGPRKIAAKGAIPTLTDKEFAGLRGVCVQRWSDEVAPFLARLDATKAVIWLQFEALEGLAALPAGTRYLLLGDGRHGGPRDLAPLARLPELRFLHLWWCGDGPTDVAPLASLKELRVLDLASRELANLDALGAASSLAALDASGCEHFSDLGFVRRWPALRRISVSHTAVADLSPLSDLPVLSSIDAHLAPVRTLPKGPLPALRTMKLGSAPVAREDVDAFRKAHPSCEIPQTRRDQLLAAVAGVDRVRVRSGGMCCRVPEDEVTRGEVKTPEEVNAFLDLLELDDCGGDEGCMCCGDPTFEFYAGDRLLAGLSFHHDRKLRWSGGPWHRDVDLSGRAREALCLWLAQHGEPGPAQSIDDDRRRGRREQRRDERHEAILGHERRAALLADLDAAGGYDGYPAVFAKHEPDLNARILLAFRLRGACDDAEGADPIGLAARYSLFADPVASVVAVAKTVLTEDEAGKGVGFWLLAHGGSDGLDIATLDALLEPATMWLLTDAEPDVRRTAIWGLGDVHRPAAVALARRLLDGRVLTRRPDDAATAPAETRGNVQAAAIALVKLGDHESLPRLRALTASWDPADRRRFEEAVTAQAEAEKKKDAERKEAEQKAAAEKQTPDAKPSGEKDAKPKDSGTPAPK